MRALFFGFLCILCLAFLVAADLNTVKQNGLKAVNAQVNNIKKLAEDTAIEVDKREGNIKVITKHIREFGDGIIGNTNFEVSKTAKSAYMFANLLGSSNDVFRCIEYKEREGLEGNDKYYSEQFLDIGRNYESRAEEYQRNLIKAWKDDYYKAIDQYGKIYQTAISNIQKATTESSVSSVVRDFEKVSKQMADIITSVLAPMNRTHFQILKVLNDLVNSLQRYAKNQVEETGKAIQKCFT